MSELTAGLRKLRLSLIPMLLSQISLIVMEIPEELLGLNLKSLSLISSSALALISFALALRGLVQLCSEIGDKFCILRKIMKYILPFLVLFMFLGIIYYAEELQNLSVEFNEIVSRPILLVPAILSTFLMIAVAYSILRLGSIIHSNFLKMGSLILIPPSFIVIAGYSAYGSALAILGTIMIILGLTRLIMVGVEVVEEEAEVPEEYEEEAPMKPRKVIEEAPIPREVRAPQRLIEKKAKLLGPSGLMIELELGLRTFGRRDFVGYVPDEDLAYISRRHFEIRGTREGFFIRDLGSLNGTWVNGNKLEKGDYVKLTNGSVIDVAEVVRLRFSYEAEDLGVPEL